MSGHLTEVEEEEMQNVREAIIQALDEDTMNAWDWAMVEDDSHKKAGRRIAEAALKCLEANGFKVVRVDS